MGQLWTIGHSTHALEVFVALLAQNAIELVADVRTVPKSRRHPQFWADELARTLPEQGVEYRYLAGLGGFRRARADSPNRGWRNASFRGYADYALTEEFGAALDELRTLAHDRRVAVMCAEALWWRCHRRIIADRLVAAGWQVQHIASNGGATAHQLTPFAAVQADGTVRYPGDR